MTLFDFSQGFMLSAEVIALIVVIFKGHDNRYVGPCFPLLLFSLLLSMFAKATGL